MLSSSSKYQSISSTIAKISSCSALQEQIYLDLLIAFFIKSLLIRNISLHFTTYSHVSISLHCENSLLHAWLLIMIFLVLCGFILCIYLIIVVVTLDFRKALLASTPCVLSYSFDFFLACFLSLISASLLRITSLLGF